MKKLLAAMPFTYQQVKRALRSQADPRRRRNKKYLQKCAVCVEEARLIKISLSGRGLVNARNDSPNIHSF